MPVYDLFSKRRKREMGDAPDVYQYEEIPKELRTQVVHIWHDVLGDPRKRLEYREREQVEAAYNSIHSVLCREYGVFNLGHTTSADTDLITFVLEEKDVNRILDAVELSFKFIDLHTRASSYRSCEDPDKRADEAIKELNARFREHGIGYQYENRKIVRVDSEFLHAEAVRPALRLLSDKSYMGPQDEFLQAHEHYRHARYKECLNDALKSFESLMKAICGKHKWAYNESDNAKTLIGICLAKNIIPEFWQNHFSGLRSVLESGIPTARNKLGGHGQGAEVVNVPQFLAAYVLHMTAATLLFLAEAEKQIG